MLGIKIVSPGQYSSRDPSTFHCGKLGEVIFF